MSETIKKKKIFHTVVFILYITLYFMCSFKTIGMLFLFHKLPYLLSIDKSKKKILKF